MEGYFFTDDFVFRLVRADVLLGDYADDAYVHTKISTELDEFEALPISPEILKHLMVRTNQIWKCGQLTNSVFEGMDWLFEIRKSSTKETLAHGYARKYGDKAPLDWFEFNVKPNCEVTINYD